MATYSQNKKAHFDYDVLETMEAGLVLSGGETKAVRNGQAKLVGAFVTFHGSDANLLNAHIAKYTHATDPDYTPERTRKLLLSKKEIAYLRGKSEENGLTIIPLSLYTKGRYIKVEIGVARGKKKHDKREATKKRETDRELRRSLKNQ